MRVLLGYMNKFIITILLTVLTTLGAWAQQRRVQNKPYIDERRFHYGFFVGAHDQSMHLSNNGYQPAASEATAGQQWVAQTDQANFGFSVGVLGEWRINSYLGLRVLPSLHFGSRHVMFKELNTQHTEQQDMKSCYIGVPVDLKIAAPRFNNYRPYVVAGVAPMYDLITTKQSKLRTKPLNIMRRDWVATFICRFLSLYPNSNFALDWEMCYKRTERTLTTLRNSYTHRASTAPQWV